MLRRARMLVSSRPQHSAHLQMWRISWSATHASMTCNTMGSTGACRINGTTAERDTCLRRLWSTRPRGQGWRTREEDHHSLSRTSALQLFAFHASCKRHWMRSDVERALAVLWLQCRSRRRHDISAVARGYFGFSIPTLLYIRSFSQVLLGS